MAKPWEKYGSSGQGAVFTDPYKQNDDRRADQRMSMEAERVRLAREQAARDAERLALQQRATEGALELKAQEAAKNQQAKDARAKKMSALVEQLFRTRDLYQQNFRGGVPNNFSNMLPDFMRPENSQFGTAGASLSEQALSAFRVPGIGSQSDAELRAFVEANRPQPGDTDLAIEEKLRALSGRVQAELQGMGIDPASVIRSLPGRDSETGLPFIGGGGAPLPPNWGAAGSNLNRPSPSAVGGGGQPYSTPEDIALQKSLTDAYRQGATLEQLNQITTQAGRPSLSPEWAAAVQSRDAGRPYQEGLPAQSGITSDIQGVLGSDLGAGVGNYLNAGGFGLPELFGGHEQFDALRNNSPASSFAGELAGGVTGALGAGALLKAGASRAANPTVARLLANPITADVAYGSSYGANTADDPLYGAVGGGVAAFLGGAAGNKVGRALSGLRTPTGAPRLSPGQSSVMEGVGKTGVDSVVQFLEQADNLGVPASLADASPDINSLTGAAIRRSPTVAGQARDALISRGRSQYDRFVGAVERDLGPVENIPQRSEDLIQQARAAAGPLYDAAYAAPGASVIDLSDLMARPSMGRALTNARRIAAEEGRDPETLGIVLGPDGATTLNQPSWQTLDYVKRGLDDVLEGYRDPTTGRLALDTEGRAVNGTLQDLLSRLDQMNPDYAAARAAYAGPASETSALRMGQRSASMTPDQLGVNVGRASPSQMDQMRLGFQSQLAENAGKMRYSTNPFESTLGTPAMEQRLATMYPDQPQGVAQLLAQAEMERNLAASSNRLIGNSMTAERGIADQAFDGPGWVGPVMQGVAETAVTGAPVMTVSRALLKDRVGDMVKLGLGKRAQAKAQDIADLTLNTSPSETIDQIRALQQQADAYNVARELLKSRGGTAGRLSGASGASSVLPFLVSGRE